MHCTTSGLDMPRMSAAWLDVSSSPGFFCVNEDDAALSISSIPLKQWA